MFKKSLLSLFAAGLLITFTYTGCKKEETQQPQQAEIAVEKKNTSFINKFTGTNCYYCGDWGWPLFIEIIDEHHGKDAVCIGTYSQNSFAQNYITSMATALDRRLPVTVGYPTFAANFYDAWSNNANTSQKMKDNINNAIAAHVASPVVANSATTVKLDGNDIVVNAHTKFFEAGDGEYNIAVLVLEDGVIGYQSGPNGGNNASHHKVLRGGNGDWGQALVNGTVAANSTFDHEIRIAKDGSWNWDNCEIATIIWKKNGSKWDFVNAHLHTK